MRVRALTVIAIALAIALLIVSAMWLHAHNRTQVLHLCGETEQRQPDYYLTTHERAQGIVDEHSWREVRLRNGEVTVTGRSAVIVPLDDQWHTPRRPGRAYWNAVFTTYERTYRTAC